ncbi:MAG TPA: hypothetical protein VFB81_12695 [Myxococcales bacterium]|nr:hypothetical protein [Myxococcales bacterium]
MIGPLRRKWKGSTATSSEYRRIFVTRAHQLLEMAWRQTEPGSLRELQEPEITGELVRRMDEIIDDPGAPRWTRHLSVHDDPPSNVPGRLGSARRRLDIKIVSAQRSPRSRFSFEAKRLGDSHPVADYLGDEGLGRFLIGDYARDEADAGMLGYVQSGTPSDWATKLGEKITNEPKRFGLVSGSSWQHQPFPNGPSHTYHTRHTRRKVGGHIEVYHTLMACC